jgi:hypothetical protein
VGGNAGQGGVDERDVEVGERKEKKGTGEAEASLNHSIVAYIISTRCGGCGGESLCSPFFM